jgi:hypothetical protein
MQSSCLINRFEKSVSIFVIETFSTYRIKGDDMFLLNLGSYLPVGKGKAVPLQAWVGPWGSGRLRLQIFLTFGYMNVVRSSPLRTGRLYSQELSWYSFFRGWVDLRARGSVDSFGKKIPSESLGIDPETLRLLAQCLNHYATPGTSQWALLKTPGESNRTFYCRQFLVIHFVT